MQLCVALDLPTKEKLLQGVLKIPCQSDKIISRIDNERRNGFNKKTIKDTSDGTFAPQGHFFLSVRAIRNPKR
jgi:hypothetical protein